MKRQMSDEVEKLASHPYRNPACLIMSGHCFDSVGQKGFESRNLWKRLRNFESDEIVIRGDLKIFKISSQAFHHASFQFFETPFPWRSLLALLLALIAQRTFEPPHESTSLGIALYIIAFSFLGWGIYRSEWTLPAPAPTSEGTEPLTYRGLPLILGIGLALVGFLLLGNNLFTRLNVTVWILAISVSFMGVLAKQA